ncbi:hypothetical protein HPB51_000441 [Rhipicephalus microplus]|uniref:Uncharacterized protein n=1 Tax=Rhipicephalus microplus TaxID=6941 RepID=A0A9J6DXI9_RHIMP|nr:hypothetical protein HPB51_000441 [Rhipicephalus microplus]
MWTSPACDCGERRKSLQAAHCDRRSFRGPKTGAYPELEAELVKFIEDVRSRGHAVSSEMAQKLRAEVVMGPSVLNVIRGNEYFRRSATDGRTCALTYSVLKNLHNRAANEYVTRNNEQEELPPLACTYFPEPDLRDLLAIADEDGMVHLLQTGQSDVRLSLKSSWQAHENAIFDVCPRPGRSHLTTASGDLSVRLWDIEQQTRVASFQGHKGSVKCVRFLPEHAGKRFCHTIISQHSAPRWKKKQKRPGGYEAGSRLISAFPACRWRRPTPKHVTCPQNAYRSARLSYVLRIFRSTMSLRGKYRTLPLKEKLAAIQEVDAGVKKTEVALKYGITKSTLTTILKAKDKLQNNASRFAPDWKRLREAAYPDLENAVLLWLKRARSSNLPINGPILREKAEELSLRLGIEDFKCSDGWISRFKERHGLSFKTTEGDDESQVLSALKAHNISADLDSYAATDDNLCVCREDTLDDLVAEVLPAQHSSESKEEPEVENVTTAQAFQYIAKPPSSCSVTACEFRNEHYLVSCGASNGALKVWDLRKNYQLYNNDPRPAICVPYTGRSAAIHGYTSIVLDVSRRRAFASCTDHHIYQYDLLASDTTEPRTSHTVIVSAASNVSHVDTPGFPQLRLSGHRAEVAVLAWDPFHPARLATCGDDNRVLLWDATAAEEAGRAMKDCTRAEVFAAAGTLISSHSTVDAWQAPSGALFHALSALRKTPSRVYSNTDWRITQFSPACTTSLFDGSARTPTRTSSSMADWFTPPTKRRLTSAASNTPGSSEHSTRSESVATSSGGQSPSPPADTILSPRKKADSAANVPQRRLLPRLNALEDDIKKDDGATDVTTCDLENIPLQVQGTPPRPVAPDATPSPPSASHSRKQHKIMARLFKRQASPAVDKRKSKAKRALLSTQQQITSFFKR